MISMLCAQYVWLLMWLILRYVRTWSPVLWLLLSCLFYNKEYAKKNRWPPENSNMWPICDSKQPQVRSAPFDEIFVFSISGSVSAPFSLLSIQAGLSTSWQLCCRPPDRLTQIKGRHWSQLGRSNGTMSNNINKAGRSPGLRSWNPVVRCRIIKWKGMPHLYGIFASRSLSKRGLRSARLCRVACERSWRTSIDNLFKSTDPFCQACLTNSSFCA